MSLNTRDVQMHWNNFREYISNQMPTIIDEKIKYFVYETAASGKCSNVDEDLLYETLSGMSNWKIKLFLDESVECNATNSKLNGAQ